MIHGDYDIYQALSLCFAQLPYLPLNRSWVTGSDARLLSSRIFLGCKETVDHPNKVGPGSSYKWSYNSYEWPYKLETGVKFPYKWSYRCVLLLVSGERNSLHSHRISPNKIHNDWYDISVILNVSHFDDRLGRAEAVNGNIWLLFDWHCLIGMH